MRVTFERIGARPFEVEVGQVLAQGGTATVHAARCTRSAPLVPEDLVVKTATPGHEPLVEREAVVSSRFEHPGLSRVLGTGRAETGQPLIALERLGSNPLLLLNGPLRPSFRDPGTPYYPLPPGRVIELAFDVLLALEFLHARGHVHADVKLSNVMVRVPATTDARTILEHVAEGRFEGVLIDLGSVRAVRASEEGALPIVGPGDAPPEVTPLYAPPEVLLELPELGGSRLVSPAMDVYSFGLALYAMLTGRVPYGLTIDPERGTDHVLELKLAEWRGLLSPWDESALDHVPLHDVAFRSDVASGWPAFHCAMRSVLRGTLDRDPRRRWSATRIRETFEEEFRLRPTGSSGPRPWTQETFQMRPRANRLVGDAPLGGIRAAEKKLRIEAEEGPPPARGSTEGPGFPDGSHLARTTVTPGEHRKGTSRFERGVHRAADLTRYEGTAFVAILHSGADALDVTKCKAFPLEPNGNRLRVTGDAFSVLPRRLTVGRAPDNDLVIGDSAVSKQHVVIEHVDGRWQVTDVGSTNGTYVDGIKVAPGKPVPLAGDAHRLSLGPVAKITILSADRFRALAARAAARAKAPAAAPKPAAPPARSELAARLAEAESRGESFDVVLDGAIVETCAAADEVLQLLLERPSEVIKVVAHTAIGGMEVLLERPPVPGEDAA